MGSENLFIRVATAKRLSMIEKNKNIRQLRHV